MSLPFVQNILDVLFVGFVEASNSKFAALELLFKLGRHLFLVDAIIGDGKDEPLIERLYSVAVELV